MNENNNLNQTPNAIPPVAGPPNMVPPTNNPINVSNEPVQNPLPPVAGPVPIPQPEPTPMPTPSPTPEPKPTPMPVPPVMEPTPIAQPEPAPATLPPIMGATPIAQPEPAPATLPPIMGATPIAQPEPAPIPAPPIAGPIPMPQPMPTMEPAPMMEPVNEPVNNEINPMNGTVTQNNDLNATPSNMGEDDELLQAYIGKNYDKIIANKFNIGALFFGPLYLCYRKMFLYGLLVFVLQLAISIFVKIPALGLLISVVLAIFVNKIYINYAKQAIKTIKDKNTDKDINGLKEICAKKGGTSVGLVILGIIVNFVIAIATIVALIAAGFGTLFGTIISDLLNNTEISTDDNGIVDIEPKNNNTYNGILFFDTNITITDYFTLGEMPQKFEDNSDESEFQYSYEGTEGVFNYCRFKLNSPSGYDDANTLIDQMAEYNSDSQPTTPETMTINGIDWYGFSFGGDFGTTYYYGTNKDGKPFLLEYEIDKDTDDDCATYREQILNEIK